MQSKTKNVVMSGLFLALGLILPLIFHMAGGMAGQVLLPMHIPVLLCGFLVGGWYGLAVGFITPFLNSLLISMPPIYPTAIAMAFELAAYGAVSGYMYKKKKINVYVSLITAMIIGRLISGAANYILLSMTGKSYMLKVFIASSFVKPIFGIILQLILIPAIIYIYRKTLKK